MIPITKTTGEWKNMPETAISSTARNNKGERADTKTFIIHRNRVVGWCNLNRAKRTSARWMVPVTMINISVKEVTASVHAKVIKCLRLKNDLGPQSLHFVKEICPLVKPI